MTYGQELGMKLSQLTSLKTSLQLQMKPRRTRFWFRDILFPLGTQLPQLNLCQMMDPAEPSPMLSLKTIHKLLIQSRRFFYPACLHWASPQAMAHCYGMFEAQHFICIWSWKVQRSATQHKDCYMSLPAIWPPMTLANCVHTQLLVNARFKVIVAWSFMALA